MKRLASISFCWQRLISLAFLLLVLLPFSVLGQDDDKRSQTIANLKTELAQATTNEARLSVYNDLLTIIRYQKDSAEALNVARAYLSLSQSEADESAEMQALKFFGDIYEHHGLIRQSIDFQEQSLSKAKQVQDSTFISLVLGDLSYTYSNLSNFEVAYTYQREAMLYAQSSDNHNRLSWLHVNLANLLVSINDIDEAYKALEKGCAIIEENDTTNGPFYAARARGSFYCYNTEEFDKAIPHLRKQLEYLDPRENPIRWANAQYDIAFCLVNLNQGDSAVPYALEAIESWKVHGQEWSIPGAYILLSKAYLKNGENQKAIACLDSVENDRNQAFSKEFLHDLYEARHSAHLQMEDTATAYRYLALQKIYLDSLTDEQITNSILQAQVRFDSDRKKEKLARQELVIDQQKKADKQKTVLLIVVGFGLLVAALLAILIFRGSRKLKATNELLTKQKQEIKERDAEKEILLREIHHRVKNNLQVISSLLSIQSRNITDEAAATAVREGQNRVNSIALIHQKLYQTEDLSEVNLSEYISQLIPPLKTAFGKNDIDVQLLLDPENLALDIDTAVPFGLIINELLTNAFKYAFGDKNTGQITIEVTDLGDAKYRLRVADNGAGLPVDFDWKKSRTMGMRLVRELTKQLRGKMEYEFANGAAFTITFSGTIGRKTIA